MIILAAIPGVTRTILVAGRPPEENLALVSFALLLLALCYGYCAHLARREGKTVREWLRGLR